MYLTGKSRGRRKLGDISFAPTGLIPFGWTPSLPDSINCDPLTVGGFYDWITGNSKSCSIAAGQQQIQQVANRAANNYGVDSPAAIATQIEADYQKAQIPIDVNTIFNPPAASATAGTPWWMWAALLGGGALIVVKVLK
jgi:hypothetical protein